MSVEKNSQNSIVPLRASAPASSQPFVTIHADINCGDTIVSLMELVECVCNNQPEFRDLLPEVSS